MNALDRLAPLVAGLLVVAFIVAALLVAAVRFAEAAHGISPP